MSRVELVTFGVRQWTKRLDQTAIRTGQARPVLGEIYDDILRIEEQVFASGGRRGGGSWKALSPATIASKVRKAEDPRILVAAGDLLASLTVPDHPDQIKNITNQRISFGTRRPGARALQFGDPTHNLPARPFIRFTRFDRLRWAKMIAGYIVGRV